MAEARRRKRSGKLNNGTARKEMSPAVKRRLRDISGLVLIFLGIAGLVCLLWPQKAPIPQLAAYGLRLIAGAGAYLFPVLLILIGLAALNGIHRIRLTHTSFGLLLLFLTFTAWRQLDLPYPRDLHNPGQLASAGGWLGGIFGWVLYTLLQRPLSYLALWLLVFISIVLLVDQPLAEFARRLHARSRNLAKTASDKAALRSERLQKNELLADGKGNLLATKPIRRISAPESALALVGSLQSSPHEDVKEQHNPRNKTGLFSIGRKTKTDETSDEGVIGSVAQLAVAPPDENTSPSFTFTLPPLTLLQEASSSPKRSSAELADRVRVIEKTLEQFNIGASVVEVASGPSVTRYEIQLAPGIKVSKIVSLADNLAMSLAAIDVRVEAPIPGKSAIGVEVPNLTPTLVTLRECLDTDEYRKAPSLLTVALGRDVSGQFRYADICNMPHLLIGGSTNSGKSACLNSLIASLVYRATPMQVKLMMIDPKRVELSLWDGIPHLLCPVVRDVRLASGLFRAALKEMDRRYDLFARVGTRNLESYNLRMGEEEKLPFIVLIVDELADLMMQQGVEIESSICRLAQLARATGIHLIIATQRPSVDIITGTIKANVSSRIAFAVASQIDSRTILDMPGAERLIGRGDMLFMPIDAAKPLRIQGCYLSETETNALVEYLKNQQKAEYAFSLTGNETEESRGRTGTDDEVDDKLYEQAVRLVVNNGQASTSMLQRRFRIGYTRAARIVELMEERGIVGPLNGARPREILVSRDEVERMFGGLTLPLEEEP